MIRRCPRCHTDRSLQEILCLGRFGDNDCGWPLLDILPTSPTADGDAQEAPGVSEAATEAATPKVDAGLLCRNGHVLEAGDFLCLECGEPAATVHVPAASIMNVPVVVNGWTLGTTLPVQSGESDLCIAHKESATGVFKHYRRGIDPEVSLYPALRALNDAHCVRLLEAGRYEGRSFEIWEYLPLGTLGDIAAKEKTDPAFVRCIVEELGRALHELAKVSLIHRDLKPANVLVRRREPLDLVLADFSTATVSEFDLQLTISRQTTRYAAPETIAGTCSTASDWWSLGVMILEMLTAGRGFEGVNERAFLLHLVTRGLEVPADLADEWKELLMGLLTRDPSQRWSWPQVERWLAGERGIPHGYSEGSTESAVSGIQLQLGKRTWSTPESFALAAVESENWEDARDILLSGRLATWLQERGSEKDLSRAAQVRDVAADANLTEDFRLTAAVLLLNEHLPLCLRGDIITSNWLLTHPDTALQWLDSALTQRLKQWGRETWLVQLKERADRIRNRVREYRLECDEEQLAAAMLATSVPMLENRWTQRRRLYPEAEHPALISMMHRRTLSEEDLILLISASVSHFRPATDVLEEAEREAYRAQVSFSADVMVPWFDNSRAEILKAVDGRVANFARCGRQVPDQWADDFRQDRRITLARALVLLAIPEDEWQEPARQEYVRNILQFFHRRLVSSLQRGGLIRMTIGRTTARLDLTELGGPARSAMILLETVLSRQTQMVSLDPAPLLAEPQREQRLRRLMQNALAYRRDTGINPLYLAFPFIVLRDARASDSAKPRIAPVLLWPIKLEMPTGQRGTVKLAFDDEREVRLNPALEGLLGSSFPEWRDMLNDLRGRDYLDLRSALDSFSHLTKLPHFTETGAALRPLPPATVRAATGAIQLHASAVLFQCDFSGQTIAQDIEQLSRGIPLQGAALEIAIRMTNPAAAADVTNPSELDRYFTAASDPSQQAAVFRSRLASGLVVQGPPGTGKSQTIVNIVSDAMGRGERVLIVCQKQAALEVVRKRLDTEGLGGRLFYLKDATSDRRPTLLQLRDQLEQPTHLPNDHARLQREREVLARHIESLEKELNNAHSALHEGPVTHPGRLSYREVIDALLRVEGSGGKAISVPGLGVFFRDLGQADAWQKIGEMAPLANLWLESNYELSPLHDLGYFSADEVTLEELRKAFDAFQSAEQQRHELLRKHDRFFNLDTPELLQSWLAEHEAALRAVPMPVARHLSQWANYLSGDAQAPSKVGQLLLWLDGLNHQLSALSGWTMDDRIYGGLALRGDKPLRELSASAARIAAPTSFWAILNPLRYLEKKRIHRWLQQVGVEPGNVDLSTLHQAAELESVLRKERAVLNEWIDVLGLREADQHDTLPAMRSLVRRLIELLQPVLAAARRVQACPIQLAAKELQQGGDPAVCGSILDACHASLALWAAERASLALLEKLRPWFASQWIDTRSSEIRSYRPGSVALDPILTALPTLPVFQTFRARIRTLDPASVPIFAKLRAKDDLWKAMASSKESKLSEVIASTLQREALLEWKRQIEADQPSLLIERDEFEQKVNLLGQKDREYREANQRMLSRCSPNATLSARGQWDDVVMLSGQRARRLREVVERGEPLGLFNLRPVWMMNPEMVSRLFPLRAGLFDVVVFDEASQLPVESALPSLFRAKRMVVSGDEKQMPPSRFFGSQMESDEDGEEDAWLWAEDFGLEDGERERMAQAAGRREVKDCPDLLTLTQNLLPTATLEIHYRSQYRELIDFSNAAFYGGRLSVPARHPDSEILRAHPMEVDRVDGEYFEQTNEDEAARVVFRLQEIWRRPYAERPSIGVVTFNLKQAELIEQEMENLAEEDDAFREAWTEESNRTQNGEDMGFFVKNLENVQGDERDWIIFSTTFGRDNDGDFRRYFGVLGHQGGERRLNVAVTRARQKVLLVTSIPVNEVSTWLGHTGHRAPSTPRDFLQAWLAYAERLNRGDFEQSRHLLRSLSGQHSGPRPQHVRTVRTSPFVEGVAAFIRQLGHVPIPAQGDAFGLDFAITHPGTGHFGLGIECDSHHHPVLVSARAREIWRPSVLAHSVKRIHRVSSRGWYHHRADEEQRLRAAVEQAMKH